ncbi:MAG: DUF2975 domain-containing protein [Georgenia sp.]
MTSAKLLRVALGALLLGALLTQVLVPVSAAEIGAEYPEVAHLVVPYSGGAILAIACLQVALVAVGRLLAFISGGAIFTPRALRWVDVITGRAVAVTLLAAGVVVHLIGVVQPGGPGVVLVLAAGVASGIALVLLMFVMRGLLKVSIAYRSELDGAI